MSGALCDAGSAHRSWPPDTLHVFAAKGSAGLVNKPANPANSRNSTSPTFTSYANLDTIDMTFASTFSFLPEAFKNVEKLQFVLIFTFLSTILTCMLQWHLQYLAFISLGPGGTPTTIIGFLKITLLGFVALRDPYRIHGTFGKVLHKEEPSGYLTGLAQRQGPRPEVRGIAPQRQINQKASRDLVHQLVATIEALPVTSTIDRLVYSTSHIERHGPALFHRSPCRQNEVCHVHRTDGSMHMVLSPEDAKIVLEAGWGERHPLARGGWFERFVPREFVLVYAPRDYY